MFCRAKNSTSTPSTAPTTRGKCVCLCCASVLWRVFTVRGPVILSGSHLHMPPSQPLTWLHCAAPMNVLPFFPLPRQPDTLHRRHLAGVKVSGFCSASGSVSLTPPTLHTHSLHLFHSFIRSLLTELQLARWQMGVLRLSPHHAGSC